MPLEEGFDSAPEVETSSQREERERGITTVRHTIVGEGSGLNTLRNMQYSVDEQTGWLRIEAPAGAAKNITIMRESGEHAGTVSNNVELINSLEKAGFAMDTEQMPAKEVVSEEKKATPIKRALAKKIEPIPVMMLDTGIEHSFPKALGVWRDEENAGTAPENAVILMAVDGAQRLQERGFGNASLDAAITQMTGQAPGAGRG